MGFPAVPKVHPHCISCGGQSAVHVGSAECVTKVHGFPAAPHVHVFGAAAQAQRLPRAAWAWSHVTQNGIEAISAPIHRSLIIMLSIVFIRFVCLAVIVFFCCSLLLSYCQAYVCPPQEDYTNKHEDDQCHTRPSLWVGLRSGVC